MLRAFTLCEWKNRKDFTGILQKKKQCNLISKQRYYLNRDTHNVRSDIITQRKTRVSLFWAAIRLFKLPAPV